MNRRLYLIAYDITEAKRLTRMRKYLKGFSTGGQKSVFECFLTGGELNEVRGNLSAMIDPAEDRVSWGNPGGDISHKHPRTNTKRLFA